MAVSIARWYKRERLELTVEFVTPAFLGNWEQESELRAAPFKALLRYWWRIVEGHRYGTPEDLFQAESTLFGSAAGAGRSLVEIMLPRVSTPISLIDVLPAGQARPGSAHPYAYIGFGRIHPFSQPGGKVLKPVRQEKRGLDTVPVPVRAIGAGATTKLALICPTSETATLKRVLTAVQYFGAIGGRSCNGWGSLRIVSNGFDLPDHAELTSAWKPWTTLLGKNYPSGLGLDEQRRPLWWHLNEANSSSWENTLHQLATTYREVRKSLPINSRPDERHLLGYPVTAHEVSEWEREPLKLKRHVSPLRLVVKRTGNTIQGFVLHLPYQYGVPHETLSDEKVWKKVHAELDRRLSRININLTFPQKGPHA